MPQNGPENLQRNDGVEERTSNYLDGILRVNMV